MEDTVNNRKTDLASGRKSVLEIAALLEEHLGEDAVVLDVSDISSWTDYIVICTVRSQAHLRGLFDNVNVYLKGMEIEPLNSRKNPGNQGWVLIDCGNFIINLMDREKP